MRTAVIGNDGLMRDLQARGGLLLLLDLIYNGGQLQSSSEKSPSATPAAADDVSNIDERETSLEVQEAALACTLAALMGHPHNCRVLLSLGIDRLIDLAGREDTPEHNRQLVLDILQVLGPYSYVECSNCGKRQPKGNHCVQCGFNTSIALADDSKR